MSTYHGKRKREECDDEEDEENISDNDEDSIMCTDPEKTSTMAAFIASSQDTTLALLDKYSAQRFTGIQGQKEFRSFILGRVSFIDESREVIKLCHSSMQRALSNHIYTDAIPRILSPELTRLVASYYGGAYEEFYACKRSKNVKAVVTTCRPVWRLYEITCTQTREDLKARIEFLIRETYADMQCASAFEPGYNSDEKWRLQSLQYIQLNLDSLLAEGIALRMFETIWL